MKIYWPRRAPGLPPGQRLMTEMPRFTDRPFKPPPDMAAEPRFEITNEGAPIAILSGADLEALGPRDHVADFHCVTTWSVTGLVWRGVPLRDVFASVGITEPLAPYLVASSEDRRSVAFLWEDAAAADVILATHLDGDPLDDRRGGPLRLVAPSQYGYKSGKFISAIDFRTERPKVMGKEHLRARVAHEERHPRLPSWMVKGPYRLTIPPTGYLAERTLRRHRSSKLGRA